PPGPDRRCASVQRRAVLHHLGAGEMEWLFRSFLRMKVNPDVFFKFHDGKFVVWNYRAHEQFELTLPYLQRLYAIATEESQPAALSTGSLVAPPAAPEPAQIDAELRAADLVSASYPGAAWGWDSLSQIFHVGTNVRLAAGAELPRDDSSEAYIEHC